MHSTLSSHCLSTLFMAFLSSSHLSYHIYLSVSPIVLFSSSPHAQTTVTFYALFDQQTLSQNSVLHTSTSLTRSIRVTSYIFLRHLIYSSFNLFLYAIFMPHASPPYNAVSTTTHSYNLLFAFILSILYLNILFCSSPYISYFFNSRLTLYIYSSIHSNM